MPLFQVEIWLHDNDLKLIRSFFDKAQRGAWKLGFEAYISGDWETARLQFQEVQNSSMNCRDGPSSFLLALMEQFNFLPPKSWEGFHAIF